jgi:uncharacterized protein YggE
MNTTILRVFVAIFALQATASNLFGQLSGSRGGDHGRVPSKIQLFSVPKSHEEPIVVKGTAQRSIKPTEMRMIWAITAQHAVPAEANKLLIAHLNKIRQAWINGGIENNEIVEDFISAVPQFKWTASEGENVLTEEFDSYLVQSNLHVRVSSERQARQLVAIALDNDVTNLIGADYFAEVDALAEEVRTEALQAAQKKSEQLFIIFKDGIQPKPANIAEQTQVIGPDSQYETFEQVVSQRVETNWSSQGRQFVRIHAVRPRNTYYKGAGELADVNHFNLPMNPEILIKSTVEIVYVNPWQQENAKKKDSKNED